MTVNLAWIPLHPLPNGVQAAHPTGRYRYRSQSEWAPPRIQFLYMLEPEGGGDACPYWIDAPEWIFNA